MPTSMVGFFCSKEEFIDQTLFQTSKCTILQHWPQIARTHIVTHIYITMTKKIVFFNWVKQLGFCDFYLEFCNSYFDYIVVLEVAKLKMEIAKPTSFLSPS
jgi:hypothetical protein